MGNATHIDHNNIYDNTTGIAPTRSTPAAIPASRRTRSVFENNRIYSNNFNDYGPSRT